MDGEATEDASQSVADQRSQLLCYHSVNGVLVGLPVSLECAQNLVTEFEKEFVTLKLE